MRGAHIRSYIRVSLPGIIPAHAGSTRMKHCPCRCVRDHPRACGEHLVIPRPFFPLMGSSPRMRGAHSSSNGETDRNGIIPAHAGSTERLQAVFKRIRDHPRACGEHTKNPSSESRNPIIELHFNQFAKKVKRCFTIRFSPMRCFVVKVQ